MRNFPLALAVLLVPLATQTEPSRAMSPASPSPREQLAALLLGTGKWPERIEVRGRILVVADFLVAAREAGGERSDVARRVLDDVLLAILTEELHHQDAWLSDAYHEQAYAAYAEQYDKTPLLLEGLVTRFKLYPDLTTFQRRWRVLQSFVRMNKLHKPDAAELQAQAKLSQDFLTGVAVEAEFWLHEAPLAADGRRDFMAAEQTARQTFEVFAAEKDRPKLSEAAPRMRPGKGEWTMLDPLRTALGEGEYTDLHHDPVADRVFAAEPGKLLGPMRGKTGFYIARVVSRRGGGSGTVDTTTPRGKERLLRSLLEQRRFLEWVDQVLLGTSIRIDGRPLVAPSPGSAGSTGKGK